MLSNIEFDAFHEVIVCRLASLERTLVNLSALRDEWSE